jgi:hypothetical protein
MSTPLTPESRKACEARLQEIREDDIAGLKNFAEYRLMSLGRSSDEGEDIVQFALAAVVQGLESEDLGRRPRLQDVVDKRAFILYLQGIIVSRIQCETKSRRIKAYHQHTPIAEDAGQAARGEGVVLRAPTPTAAEQAALNDFQSELFARLRQRAPQRLRATLEEWEKVFQDSDAIPSPSFRKYRVELRGLAREVLEEIGGLEGK